MINRAIGIHYFQRDQDSLGEYYLNQSLKSENLDLPTKKANYRDLANFNFAIGNYIYTGAYLDSLLSTIPDETIEKRRTQRERDNLNGVIKYENIVLTTDSLLYLTKLSKKAQLEYFQNYIEKKRHRRWQTLLRKKKESSPFLTKAIRPTPFTFIILSLWFKVNKNFDPHGVIVLIWITGPLHQRLVPFSMNPVGSKKKNK